MDTQTFWARLKSFYDDYKVFLGVLAALLVLAVIAYQHYNTPKLGFGTLVAEDPQIVLLNGDVPFTVKTEPGASATGFACYGRNTEVKPKDHRPDDSNPAADASGSVANLQFFS